MYILLGKTMVNKHLQYDMIAQGQKQSGARERRARNSCFLGVSGKTSQRKLYLRWTLKAHAEKGNHYGLTVLKKYLICLSSLWWATIFSLSNIPYFSLSLISILIKMKGRAIHSSILAWRIPWTEKSGGLQSMGSQRVGHNWATNTHTHSHTHLFRKPRFFFSVQRFYLSLISA